MIGASTVDVGNHEVERGADCDEVSYHITGAAEVHDAHKVEAGALEMHAEGCLLTHRLDVNAESATARLHLLIPAAGGELDNLGHLSADVTFGYAVH